MEPTSSSHSSRKFVAAVPGYTYTLSQMMADGVGLPTSPTMSGADRADGRLPRPARSSATRQHRHPAAGERQDRRNLGELGQRGFPVPVGLMPEPGPGTA